MKLLKNNKMFKKIAGIFAVAALASLAIFPVFGMRADSPRFNFMVNDNELFTGRNISKSEEILKDPVAASDGETVNAMIYYHNGMVNTVAQNTTVKVTTPSVASDASKLSASISADNAQSVSDTVVDNVIFGKSGLTINTAKPSTLEIVSGSVKWFPNSKDGVVQPQALPFNQTGAELFTAKGLNLGNINGCWDYAGYVSFLIKIKAVPELHPAINIEKTVRTAGTSDVYTESVSFSAKNNVEFKIDVKNTGDTVLSSVNVSDQLPSGLTVVEGSAILAKNGLRTAIDLSKLLQGGVDIGSMKQNEVATITFEASTPLPGSLTSTYTNLAKVVSDNLTDQDTANVVLNAGKSDIERHKTAYNKTQAIDATKKAAKAGDEVVYTLITKNVGNISAAEVVIDDISDVLEYADLVSGNGGTLVKDGAKTMIKYASQNIAAASEVKNTFTVKVKNPLPTNAQSGYSYDYKLYNIYGNSITIDIEKPVVPKLKPILSVDKFVRNVTSNQLEFVKANTAYAGETLEYKIVFKNVGEAAADYIKISDMLPANVSLDKTAAAVIGIAGVEQSISENITYGYILKSLAIGEEGYIRFRAVISNQIASGEILKNTAYLNDEGVDLSSSAETVIKQKVVVVESIKPILPRTGSASSIIYSLIMSLLATGGIAFAYERVKK